MSPHGTHAVEVFGDHPTRKRDFQAGNASFHPKPSPSPAIPAQGLHLGSTRSSGLVGRHPPGQRLSWAGCVLRSAADCGASTEGRL